MRISMKQTSTTISLTLISLTLALQACTHQTSGLSDESLEARGTTSSESQQKSADESPEAILEQMAPAASERETEPAVSASLDDSGSSDYIDPNEVGLGPTMQAEAEAEIAPDLHQATRQKRADNDKSKSKSKSRSKAAKGRPAAILAHDGEDPAAMQSEGIAADPTSRVAEVSVMFNRGSSTLHKKYVQRLKEVAGQLKGDRQLKVTLAGKTEAKGNKKRNKALALKRAQAVKSTLMKYGVKPSQIQIEPVELLADAQRDSSQGRMVEVFFQN